MDEGEYQANLIWAIRQQCEKKNGADYRASELSIKPTNAQEQSLLNENGKPYDVGIVLEKAYFVGMELKVTVHGSDGAVRFKSWNQRQFQQYKDLTASSWAPLFYGYNLEYPGGEVQDPIEILAGSRISRPVPLPGPLPTIQDHELLSDWLDGWFDDPVGKGATRFDHATTNDVPLIYDVVEYGFPNLVWLVALSSPKLTLRSIVSNNELFEMVKTSTAAWKKRKPTLSHIPQGQQLTLLLEDMQAHFSLMLRDAAQQIYNESDMDDKPEPAQSNDRHSPWKPKRW